MKKRFQLLALSALCVLFAHAQFVAPSEGVFRIINVGYNAALMENYETNELRCTATIGDADDFDQLWILKKEGTGYSIQNAYTRGYIQTGNDVQEKPYWTGTTAKTFTITLGGGDKKGYNIFDPGLNKQGLHSKGANGNVVRWVDCDPSQWQFEKVEVSQEAMTLAQAEYAEFLRQKVEFENYCAELLENRDELEEALAKYFDDAACTILKEEFTSVSEEDLRTAMAADNLPAELIDMAVKVKTDEWSEDNEKAEKPGWNSHYAKKFRVQMVEPHSIAGEITEWIGHQGHTNMDNPTGLYGNNRQVLYVMVEGEIKEGAELYATWLIGHDKMPNYNNGYGDRGVSLKPGLNIVPIRKDGCALYFNYLVHTFDKTTWQFTNKLSDYDDLKIHVAGGHINGYYSIAGDSLYTPDNDDDWVYYEERANLKNITILGRYEVLQFELNDVVNYTDDKGSTWSEKGLAYYFPERLPTEMPNSPAFTAPNQRINGIVEAWDRIFLAEKMTLGVASKADVDSMNKLFPRYDGTWTEKAEIYNYDDALYAFCDSLKDRDGDYGEYYNHRGVAFGTRTGYMYGSWDHSGYHINTTHSILTCIATEAGPTWGPAHEIGHQHQALYTLNGEMEVTNNTFANVAAWYMGMGTSRVNGTEGNLAHVYENLRDGGYLLSNNIWVLTQRYYRLWLYYHRAGNNTQFFPRLFELLRKNPMERSYGSGSEMRPVTTDGKTTMEEVGFQLTNGYRSYLHFYKLCCEAAQEDLTEFFRAYGCFVPVDGVFQGDYTNSKYYTTQKEIDKAIREVKAKGYPVNNKVLFINDCTNGATYGHDGTTRRSFWDPETGRSENGEVGLYVDYLNGTPITGEYVYTLEDLKLTIKGGKGAVGFAIYNEKGEIQAFSNNHSFVLNDKVENLLRAGKATLYAVPATGDDVVIKRDLGDETDQRYNLEAALDVARKYLEKVDETGQKVGYMIADSITEYIALVAEVEEVLKNGDTSEKSYGEWFLIMDAANAQIEINTDVRVPFIPGCYYAITLGSSNGTRYIGSVSGGLNATVNELTDNMQWRIVPAEDGETYYLQNRETRCYISVADVNARAKAESSDITSAIAFRLVPDAPGEFIIQRADNDNANFYYSSTNHRVMVGAQTSKNNKWTLSIVDNMLGMPIVAAEDKVVMYHLERTDNNKLAKYNSTKAPMSRGKIQSYDYDEDYANDYLFYFTQGNAEGTYAIYSYTTGLSVTYNNKVLYADKSSDTTIDYAINLNAEHNGLEISADAGAWYMPEESSYFELSVEDTTTWRLVRMGTMYMTMEQTEVSIMKTKTATLSVETNSDKAVVWSSSNENIAKVDANTGEVTALEEGTAIITATINNGMLKATCQVTVEPVGEGVSNATAELNVQVRGGLILISGLNNGAEVTIYDAAGNLIGSANAANGTAAINTGLSVGSTAIVKFGNSSKKISIQ